MKEIINHFKKNWIRHGFETLYVIVGILVAFSLNDWNESRKARITEISVLNELIASLSADSSDLSFNIAIHNKAIKSSKIILDALNGDEVYNDSLAYHFAAIHNYTNFASRLGPYESLKSMGFETISNKSLRIDIIDLYDRSYKILQLNENILTDDIQELKRNFLQDHFEEFQVIISDPPYYAGEMVPNNFTELRLSKSYKYHVSTLHTSHSSFNVLNGWNIERIGALKGRCQEEINLLK